MRRVIFVFLLTLILNSCSTKTDVITNLIVYPKGSEWLVEYKINEKTKKIPMKFPIFADYKSEYNFYKKDIETKSRLYDRIAFSNQGLITCITKNGRNIKIYKLSHSERKFVTNLVTLPADHSALTIVMRNNILFVGGKGKSEVLGYYNLDVPDPKWNPISIPDELIKYGKAIDDLLLIDNYLVVVDNIVVPKWILKYDISNPVKPFLSTIQELDSHGTYEEITKSCHKDNHFFILSNTSSPAGTIEHISLLDSVFNEIGYFSNEIRHKNRNEYLNDSNEIFYSWNSIEVIDNFLLIPSDNKGLGILNLSKIDLNKNGLKKAKEEIIYTKLSNNQNSKVLNVLTFPNYDKIVVVMSINGIFRTKELSINDIEKIIKDS